MEHANDTRRRHARLHALQGELLEKPNLADRAVLQRNVDGLGYRPRLAQGNPVFASFNIPKRYP